VVRGSGLPVPHRRTFATGILPSLTARRLPLRHPGSAGRRARLLGHGQPRVEFTPRLTALGLERAVKADRP